jgi:hypothetical protein
LSEIDRVRDPVFEMIVRLLSDLSLAQSEEETSSRPLSFSSDDMMLVKREAGSPSRTIKVVVCLVVLFLTNISHASCF